MGTIELYTFDRLSEDGSSNFDYPTDVPLKLYAGTQRGSQRFLEWLLCSWRPVILVPWNGKTLRKY